jgi:hypothetical protein
MVTPIKEKKRSCSRRKIKKIILIGTEGNNKTEKIYFKNLNQFSNKYVIHFAKGNNTDPMKIVQDTINSSGENDFNLDFNFGDLAFSVFDTDTNPSKQNEINNAIEYGKKHNVSVILSNPCFEVWYLQHFKYSTKQFSASKNVVKELRKYIPKYDKNKDVFPLLWEKRKVAIKNCKNLKQYHINNNHGERNTKCNPSSEVYFVLEKIFM